MKNKYNKEFIKLLSINFIFIVIFINGYSLGEISLINYFNDHPKGILICTIHQYIHGNSCEISYDRPNYIIKLKRDHEQKTIQLHNVGTSEKPIFKVILQDNWPSEDEDEIDPFNQDNEILFKRNNDNIVLYIQYKRGINKYYDSKFFAYFSIDFEKNSDLETYETKLTETCLYMGTINELEKEVLSTHRYKYPQIDTLKEIDKIYRNSYHQLCLPKSQDGCYIKSVLLSRIIKDKYHHDYPPPIALMIINPDLGLDDTTLGSVKWRYHYVLFYVNKEDQKIYILDTFFLDDGVIEFDDWIKRINGKNDYTTIVEACRIEE